MSGMRGGSQGLFSTDFGEVTWLLAVMADLYLQLSNEWAGPQQEQLKDTCDCTFGGQEHLLQVAHESTHLTHQENPCALPSPQLLWSPEQMRVQGCPGAYTAGTCPDTRTQGGPGTSCSMLSRESP